MRVPLSALLVAAALAGCLGPSAPSTPAAAGWTLDCTLGAHERDAGRAWAQDCLARASHTPGHKSETWLAVNPLDPDNVIVGAKDLDPALSASCVWNGLFVTHDGGVSWKDVYISGKYEDRQPGSPYYGYACSTDPMGVFTADGTAHWLVEMYNLGGQDAYGPLPPDPSTGRGILQPGWKLVLAHSRDGGDTWPESEVTTLQYGDGVAALNDYSRITDNPATGSVVTVINTFAPAVGAFSLPVPGTVTCSVLAWRGGGAPVQAVPVQPRAHTGSANPASLFCQAIAASPRGDLVLAATGTAAAAPGGDAAFSAWFAQSADDGRTWTDFAPGFPFAPIPGRFEESEYRTGTNFELAFDRTDGARSGTLYAMYAADGTAGGEGMQGGDDADVYVRASPDGGRTWGPPSRVNRNVTGHQFMGNLAVAGDGSLHAFFLDKQYDRAHKGIDVTYARSDDGGRTWGNRRVTTASFDGDVGKHQEGFPFIGDYTGAGAVGRTVWGAFPDTSNGETGVVAVAKVEWEG